MHSEHTNLLPKYYVKQLRHGYFLRLVCVATIMAVFLLLIHGLLLMPAYLYASTRVNAETRELARISNTTTSSEEKEVRSHIQSLSSDTQYLGRLASTPTASGALRALLQVPRAGVQLSSFSYTAPVKQGGVATMRISGVAASRDDLRQYTIALGNVPYVANVDLPISAYAKERAIPFTLTVTGSLLP